MSLKSANTPTCQPLERNIASSTRLDFVGPLAELVVMTADGVSTKDNTSAEGKGTLLHAVYHGMIVLGVWKLPPGKLSTFGSLNSLCVFFGRKYPWQNGWAKSSTTTHLEPLAHPWKIKAESFPNFLHQRCRSLRREWRVCILCKQAPPPSFRMVLSLSVYSQRWRLWSSLRACRQTVRLMKRGISGLFGETCALQRWV